MIFKEESAIQKAPTSGGAEDILAPALMIHGTEEQKREYLAPISRGEVLWSQGYSEPGAGSDLASLQTRATRDGDEYVINGQKVWNGSHRGDWIHTLVRTDPEAPKHRGISYVMINLRQPGVSIRPIWQIHDSGRFNEVFFDRCRLPSDAVLGKVGDGWRNAITTLMNERVSIGTSPGGFGHPCRALIAEARRVGKIDDRLLVDRLVQLSIAERILELLGKRVTESMLAGTQPGPEGSIAKLAGTKLSKDSAALAMEIVGPSSIAWESSANGGSWANTQEHTVGLSIAGGTDEIQKNILAERVLGLPREPRVKTNT